MALTALRAGAARAGDSAGAPRYKALYAYDATDSTQISFVVNTILTVSDQSGTVITFCLPREWSEVAILNLADPDLADPNGWWFGTNASGQEGFFPSNFVEIIHDDTNMYIKSSDIQLNLNTGGPPPSAPNAPTPRGRLNAKALELVRF